MSEKRDNAAVVGAAIAACAACCAGPILGVLAAIGLGTAAGFALFGTIAVVIGAVVAALVMIRRRRRAATCSPVQAPGAVRVEFTGTREG